jgi:TRAP-type C4-dicarboxylate transport system permease small subunit
MKTALTIFVLLAILAGAVWVGYYGWESAGNVVMPAWGWVMMGLGIFFTLLVGVGLMALVFYSSRAGYDETPEVEADADSMTPPKKSSRGKRQSAPHQTP